MHQAPCLTILPPALVLSTLLGACQADPGTNSPPSSSSAQGADKNHPGVGTAPKDPTAGTQHHADGTVFKEKAAKPAPAAKEGNSPKEPADGETVAFHELEDMHVSDTHARIDNPAGVRRALIRSTKDWNDAFLTARFLDFAEKVPTPIKPPQTEAFYEKEMVLVVTRKVPCMVLDREFNRHLRAQSVTATPTRLICRYDFKSPPELPKNVTDIVGRTAANIHFALAIPKGDFKEVVFVENGNVVETLEVPPPAAEPPGGIRQASPEIP